MAEIGERRIVAYPVAWFNDLNKRQLLELDPPYQRRSVWNQSYRDYFIETILLDYPAPPIFLHEEISPEGVAEYSVVDGKQRLTAIFDFVDDVFPVSEKSPLERLQGKYFSEFDPGTKTEFWRYQLPAEFLPVVEEGTLKNIFDRLNRNVARLTRQELRHAKFFGEFARSAENMSDLLLEELPSGFPNIALSSQRQMKDVELVAQLLLLTELGPVSFSQDALDAAYSDRDTAWEEKAQVERRFRATIRAIQALTEADAALTGTRLRNQADFYSLFGAVLELHREKVLPAASDGAARLAKFVALVGDEGRRERNAVAKDYYEAARSASNDPRQRTTRINTLKTVLTG
jgi:hypothetical protein